MDKTLTISVAAYNVEPFLKKCLDSLVVDEVLEDLDVIIENDGSKDKTAQIANEYVEMYPDSFRLINKENGGYGSTINQSIKLARGKYFKLLDGDDWFEKDGLISLIRRLKKLDSDCVITRFNKVKDETFTYEEVVPAYHPLEGNIVKVAAIKKPVIFGHWQLTVKTEHLKHENISLPEHMFYTDQLFVVHSLSGIETISFLDFPVYSYRVGRDGQTVSRQSRIKNADQAVTVFKYILDVYSEKVEQGKSNPVLQARVARYYHYVIKTLLLLPRSMNAFKQLISLEKYTKEKSPAIYKDVFTMGRPVSVLRMTGYLVYFYVGGKIKNWE